MWCDSCYQDVPAITDSDDERHVCCARCGAVVGSEQVVATDEVAAAEPDSMNKILDGTDVADDRDAVSSGSLDFEYDWQLEDDIRTATRIAETLSVPVESSAHAETFVDFTDQTQHALADRQLQVSPQVVGKPSVQGPPQPSSSLAVKRSPVAAWTSLSLGLMAFACGGVLLTWAYVSGRGELWNLGVPLVVAGQAGLLIGLVLQLEGLWQSNRRNSDQLGTLDNRLSDLTQTTAMLGTTHSSAAQSFYAHMAEGANPNLLLADLKGQLDLLALKLSKQQG